MYRKEFIQKFSLISMLISLGSLRVLSQNLPKKDKKMPVLFIGHGSPMNGMENNEFTSQWKNLGLQIPRPEAVLCVSAHWLTKGTYITAMNNPKTIHDFEGFPKELFKVQYPAPGNEALAKETSNLIQKTNVALDYDWGLDHGTWTVVRHMYPEADIPVLQLSIDYSKPAQYHYELAQDMAVLRSKGVLIIGSGNMVHNLGMVAWDKMNIPNYGFDWAIDMNSIFKKHISENNHKALIDYTNLGSAAKLAIPTPDHYYPLIYSLGLKSSDESIEFFNDKLVAGSLTMTSVIIG